MTQRGWEELRPHLRDERPPDDTTVVVRGGRRTPWQSSRCMPAGRMTLMSWTVNRCGGSPCTARYTITLDGDDQAALNRLLDALGPTEANKYHRRKRPGRR
jgi:hypothetical protein